jgi:hypothetical protein
MEILWRLLLGHLLADFAFQTDFINHWKRTSPHGLLAHSLMHPLFCAALCWPFLGTTWAEYPALGLRFGGWTCIALIFLTHWLQDWWRIFAIKRYRVPDNSAFFLWDQVVHLSVILALAPLSSASGDFGGFFPEKWAPLGCLFVLVTHAGTVILYFVEKDSDGAEFPGFDVKYLAIAERLVLALCFLLPSVPTAAAFAAGWFALVAWLRRRRVFDLNPIPFYGGAALAAACGLAARAVYYGG